MSIQVQPYDDHAAMAVFSDLDGSDLIEAHVMRGVAASHLALFAEWRSMAPQWVASYILATKGYPGFVDRPFAVLAVGNTGQYGVGQGAFLARPHHRYRGPIARAGIVIRRKIEPLCHELGIRRIEARCHDAHPTASVFLQRIGFEHETAMPGFGPDGCDLFHQYAFTPAPKGETPCAE